MGVDVDDSREGWGGGPLLLLYLNNLITEIDIPEIRKEGSLICVLGCELV
jgi:hypothetical protein